MSWLLLVIFICEAAIAAASTGGIPGAINGAVLGALMGAPWTIRA